MINLIAAVSRNGVIGKDNGLPWEGKYKEDMLFFRKMTKESTVIMGRNTWISMGSRLLPKRRNILISKTIPKSEETVGFEIFDSFSAALGNCKNENVWIIGGTSIYSEAMKYADNIYVTHIPEEVYGNVAYFPYVNPHEYRIKEQFNLDDSTILVTHYARNIG